MSLLKNTPQPVPIYSSIEESYFKNNDCNYNGKVVVSPLRNLPSFILIRPNSLDNAFSFEQLDSNGAFIKSFTVISRDICYSSIIEDGVLKDIVAFDFPFLNLELDCGYSYIKITNGTNVWYTELINFIDFDKSISKYTRIEYRNNCNITNSCVPYGLCEDFKFRFYLDELNGECCPERTLEVELETNNDLSEVESSSVYKKRYNLKSYYLPHYLVDSLYFMSQHCDVNIFPKNELVSIHEGDCIKDITIEKIDEDNKCCFEQINISFQREEDIKNVGCCGDINEIPCLSVETEILAKTDAVDQAFYTSQNLAIGAEIFIESDLNPTVNDWANNVGNIATWNGSGWDYRTPTETYISIVGVIYQYIGGLLELVPYGEITSTGIGTANLVAYIPDYYNAEVSFSIDGGLTFNKIGDYTQAQLLSGIGLTGSSPRFFRVRAFNYNCDDISTLLNHTFPGT